MDMRARARPANSAGHSCEAPQTWLDQLSWGLACRVRVARVEVLYPTPDTNKAETKPETQALNPVPELCWTLTPQETWRCQTS